MKIQLSKNIRYYRKKQGYTQEQLAEALGVTVGAVSKWETGSSVPDIQLIVELAYFFQTSVDVLLGYEWKEGSLGDILNRLKEGQRNKEYTESIQEANKAIQKFPHNFDVLYQSASLYLVMGFDLRSKEALEKAIQLYTQSLKFIEQNQNPEINVYQIKQRLVKAYQALLKYDEAIRLLEETNINGCNNGMLGYFLTTFKKDYETGLRYLSLRIEDYIIEMSSVMSGYSNTFLGKKQYKEAVAAAQVYYQFLESLKKPGTVGVLDYLQVGVLVGILTIYSFEGSKDKVIGLLNQIYDKAVAFREKNDYSTEQIRFYFDDNTHSFSSFLGSDILSGIEEWLKNPAEDPLREIKSEMLFRLWEDIKNERRKK